MVDRMRDRSASISRWSVGVRGDQEDQAVRADSPIHGRVERLPQGDLIHAGHLPDEIQALDVHELGWPTWGVGRGPGT